MDMNTGSILMLYARNTPQTQRQTHYIRVKCSIKIFQSNGSNKKSGKAIINTKQNSLQTKITQRIWKRYFIVIKRCCSLNSEHLYTYTHLWKKQYSTVHVLLWDNGILSCH